jgi:hypothetical protein
MTGKRKTEARRWFQQAYYDLKATRWNIEGGFSPNVVKVEGLQRRGGKGDAVVYYREPLTKKYLKTSGFPEG